MLHLMGAALLLMASILLRQSLLSQASVRRRTLRSLAEGFLSLAQSVRATLTPFPTLLEGLSHEDGAGTFFTSVRAGLSCGQTLANAWRAAARTLPLAEREKETVAALGDALGGEEESVCAALTHTARELSDAERSLFARSREEGRVMTALCLGGGTLLGILLL